MILLQSESDKSSFKINGQDALQFNSEGLIQATGTKNRIINGNCTIVQRANSTSTNGNYGGPDRFRYLNGTNGTITQSQSSLSYNGVVKNTVRQTINSAPTDLNIGIIRGIEQRIEGYNCYDLSGSDIAISFIFNTNVAGTYSLTLRLFQLNASYTTTFSIAANAPSQITKIINIPSNLAIANDNSYGITFQVGTLTEGPTQTTVFDVWQSPLKQTANINTNWASTIGNFIELTELQLEKGGVATPFEHRSFGIELSLCQRYYEKSYALDVAPGTTTGIHNGQFEQISLNTFDFYSGYVGCPFKVPKRTIPTMSFYNANGINHGAYFNYSTGNIDNNVGLHFATPDIFAVYGGNNTLLSGNLYATHWAADAEL